MEENRRVLTELFAATLFALEPESVLDIGCGVGTLVGLARERGVDARGIEPGAEAVERAKQAGLPVEVGDACELPFEDESFDWVTLRHVPHHLPDPRRAFAEAWRVAKVGLVIAEPTFDAGIESQRLAEAIDRFLKTLDRKRGMFHAGVMDADELLALLPQAPASVALERNSPLRSYSTEDFVAEVAQASGGRELDETEGRVLEALAGPVEAGHVTLNGTLILTVGKGRR